MNKLLLFILLMVLFTGLQALQADEEMSMQAFFYAKHAVDRAVHAAALQTDPIRLSEGVADLDAPRAREETIRYLRENLRLDEELGPVPGSYLQDTVQVVELAVIGADQTFPYRFARPEYGYEVTLRHPGVVLLIRIRYPRMYRLLQPVEWVVKGAAELVD